MNTILNNIALLNIFVSIHLEVTFIHNDLQKRNKGNSKETVFFIYNSKFIWYLETS